MKFKKKTIIALSEMIKPIDNKERIPMVTFIIDTVVSTFFIIGGKSDSLRVISVPFKDQDTTLKTGKWSIDAGMFKDYIQDYLKSYNDSQELILEFHDQSKTSSYIIGYTIDGAIRRWECSAACEKHLDHIKSLENKNYQDVSTSALQSMIKIAKSHYPLEWIKIDSTKCEITVQRDDDISTVTLPKDFPLEIDFIANQNSLDTIEHICQNTQSSTLMINIDNEQLNITDGQYSLSCSLNALLAFNDKLTNYKMEGTCVVNIHALKSEIKTYIRVNEIKHNNINLLYFTKNDVYISGFGFTVKSFQNLSALCVTTKQPLLYKINLRELLKVPFKKITKMKEITLKILQAADGSRKLAFYNEHDLKRPYTSIPIELNTNKSDLKAMQDLMAIYNKQTQQNSGKQIDLLGFEDI